MNLDWKWTDVQAAPIPNGRVVLRMADSKDDIAYAIAYKQGEELTITASENKNATLVVSWMALPR
jgi:hypothetical protein